MSVFLYFSSLSVLFPHVEAWAVFVGEFVVSVHGCVRESVAQFRDESGERYELRLGAGILWTAGCLVPSADVADADRVVVVSQAVCADLFERTASVDFSVEVDDIVVANVVESSLEVPEPYVGDGGCAPLGGVAAMDDDFVYGAHYVVS